MWVCLSVHPLRGPLERVLLLFLFICLQYSWVSFLLSAQFCRVGYEVQPWSPLITWAELRSFQPYQQVCKLIQQPRRDRHTRTKQALLRSSDSCRMWHFSFHNRRSGMRNEKRVDGNAQATYSQHHHQHTQCCLPLKMKEAGQQFTVNLEKIDHCIPLELCYLADISTSLICYWISVRNTRKMF